MKVEECYIPIDANKIALSHPLKADSVIIVCEKFILHNITMPPHALKSPNIFNTEFHETILSRNKSPKEFVINDSKRVTFYTN